MNTPVSTYRLQFNTNFTFQDLEKALPYLHKLGVKTIYASPIFTAVPESTHGYDGLNPHEINPEIGTKEQLLKLNQKLKEYRINWFQDIVPNHMAFHPQNKWLMDVLEKGPQSPYCAYFDTVFASDLFSGKLMVPFLGSPLEEVIEKKELKLSFEQGHFVLQYFDNSWPVSPRSYPALLQLGEGEPNQALKQLLEQITEIKKFENEMVYHERWQEFKLQLASLMKGKTVRKYINNGLEKINQNPELLKQLAAEQEYRLCSWKETDEKINYRRFFTVNSLICLNIQDEKVFLDVHKLIKELLGENVFQGLRIDHIDGLYNPEEYLKNLRILAGKDIYIIVEKILGSDEILPESWPVQGNTGYDFLTLLNGLFVHQNAENAFTNFYQDLTGDKTSVQQQLRVKKAFILYNHMQGELDNLYHLFAESGLTAKEAFEKITEEKLKSAIGEFLIECPVYRYYAGSFPLEKEEYTAVETILNRLKKHKPELEDALQLLKNAFLEQDSDTERNKRALHFYRRCMQFTGPLMAKGAEDTLFYTYNRFISQNEVGGSPENFGISPDEFHQKMIFRQENWPLSMNASSTHDTKRGEDARARLNVLSDLSDEWLSLVKNWQRENEGLRKNDFPDKNDEYFIYQAVAGTHPMPGCPEEDFVNRIQAYLEKAFREAKINSNWTEPNMEYEEAVKDFTASLLTENSTFRKSFEPFSKKAADFGIVNSLSQLLLKFTCPGVSDIYQGCELWDLSLVDPDNRRKVDYVQRSKMLESAEFKDNEPAFIQKLWKERYSGKIKLWLTALLLNERSLSGDVFTEGLYTPLEVTGKYKEHVLAFARRYDQKWYVTAVPLHAAVLAEKQKKEIMALDWKDTRIMLPEEAPAEWQDLLSKRTGKQEKGIAVQEIFTALPLAFLKLENPPNKRGAGILLHITSLPSAFSVGDLGPEAKAFADFLHRSRQKYWQLLPINPTGKAQQYSPYSAYSAMAGNPLLISPELLVQDGLLDEKLIKENHIPPSAKADFEKAQCVKTVLFDKAWMNFKNGDFKKLKNEFEQFCMNQTDWLEDFSLYSTLKQEYQRPWYEWPEEYKSRKEKALSAVQNEDEVKKAKWLQFLFFRQWESLKKYCNALGIKLFGDIPFYVSYDSADVWAHPDIFELDKKGRMIAMAGVPPDYFNEDGQLWGMPLFRWDILKKQDYDWWLRRLQWNLKLFDLLRLDHFRAFSAYWQVQAGEETAKNGSWKPGPGVHFFEVLRTRLGSLPFVAEDLGDIDEPVYQLRDEFHFPGMKILQFAFSENMGRNLYIPHQHTSNFVVYTGTHDNNTVRGWFEQDTDKETRKRLNSYTGQSISKKNVHTELCRMTYASTAETAILPMQDILGLDETARMNTPASIENNWLWRMLPNQLDEINAMMLREWVEVYGR